MSEQQGCGCGSNNQSQQPEKTSTGVSSLIEKVFVNSTEQEIRMSHCRACEHFEPVLVRCKVCGCFLEAKTRLRGFHCALPDIGEEAKW